MERLGSSIKTIKEHGLKPIPKRQHTRFITYLCIYYEYFIEHIAFLGSLGPSELIIIALIVLLLFGGKKIPELMRGMGKGIREFNNAKDGMRDEIRKGMNDDEPNSSSKEN